MTTLNSIQSPIQTQAIKAPSATLAPTQAETPSAAGHTLIQDSSLIGSQKSSHQGAPVQLHSLDYAKKGAVGGAIVGGVALPVVAFLIANYTPANVAFTAGFALQTLAVGAAGGAAVGGLGGLTVGGISDGIQSLLKK